MRLKRVFERSCAVFLFLMLAAPDALGESWPGGTLVEFAPAGYGHDVSGAVWDPLTETLWTCEDGPGFVRRASFDSVLATWVVEQSWEPGGDIEAITLREFDGTSIFVGIEQDNDSHRLIREYLISGFSLVREWDLLAMLPGSSNSGLEALTFIADSSLAAMHFVDSSDVAYESSQFGTGGLFFAGHQATGEIFVFDLDRSGMGTDLPHVHVTTISTGQDEIAALEFDRTNGLLYAWHDGSIDMLQVFQPDCCGHFTSLAQFDNPFCCNWNMEGLALAGNDECGVAGRSLVLIRDQPDTGDPSLYEDIQFPCDCNGNAIADPIDIASGFSTDANLNGVPDECDPTAISTPAAAIPPGGLALRGNEPNPFNPRTVIAFAMPREGHALLSIYDVTGRHMRTLLNRSISAGNHEVSWDGIDEKGRPAAPGIYLYRIEAEGLVETRRMVLLK